MQFKINEEFWVRVGVSTTTQAKYFIFFTVLPTAVENTSAKFEIDRASARRGKWKNKTERKTRSREISGFTSKTFLQLYVKCEHMWWKQTPTQWEQSSSFLLNAALVENLCQNETVQSTVALIVIFLWDKLWQSTVIVSATFIRLNSQLLWFIQGKCTKTECRMPQRQEP